MLKITMGKRASAASANDSCISESPWPVDPVAARAPVVSAPQHMPYGFELALGVHAHAADLGKAFREVLEQLGERCHGVPGEEAATGDDRGLGHRLRALHEPATGDRGHCSSSIGSS